MVMAVVGRAGIIGIHEKTRSRIKEERQMAWWLWVTAGLGIVVLAPLMFVALVPALMRVDKRYPRLVGGIWCALGEHDAVWQSVDNHSCVHIGSCRHCSQYLNKTRHRWGQWGPTTMSRERDTKRFSKERACERCKKKEEHERFDGPSHDSWY